MKILGLILFACSLLFSQAPAPKPAGLAPETVVATIDGKSITAGEMQSFVAALPPQAQQNFQSDPKAFIQQYALLMKLSTQAEKSKLDRESPYKESLQYARMQVMANARLGEAYKEIIIVPAEQQKFYDANKDRYTQVKVKVLYIPFSANPQVAAGSQKKPLTEAEAKTKIEKLLAEIRSGADFVKLVKEHSEDMASASKDGDFGTIRRSDSIPDPIKTAIFSLKAGQVSEPVRQPNGFYLFRVEEVNTQAYTQIRDEIFNELKQARFKEWLDNQRDTLNVKVENETFFKTPGAPVPAPPAPAKQP